MLSRLLRTGEGRMVRHLSEVHDRVDAFSSAAAALSETELMAKTAEFRIRHQAGESLDDLLGEAFAVAGEAAFRVLGQRPYYTQVMAAAGLHINMLVEMAPGEGKTLSCALAAYLKAIPGHGVHIITTDTYLAESGAETMGPLYQALGLTVAAITPQMEIEQRRAAYRADITYATVNEVGYDYLRDNIATVATATVQRDLNVVIVDDADTVLTDQANQPLIITDTGVTRDASVTADGEVRANVLLSRYWDRSVSRRSAAELEVDATEDEKQIWATIPVASYLSLYRKLGAITAVAGQAGAEIAKVYHLRGASVPNVWPSARTDHPDLIYKTREAKWVAVVDDVSERHERGQPVLIGAADDDAAQLGELLTERGLPHRIADSRDPRSASVVISEAARFGAITIAPGTTGRGVDIPLDSERVDEVREGGGLYVIGTGRYPAARTDLQLRGRAGRRGEPGESRFYLSLRDNLVQYYNREAAESLVALPGLPEDAPLASKAVTRVLDTAQLRVEGGRAARRIDEPVWDAVLGQQRTVIYKRRREILDEHDLSAVVHRLIDTTITAYVAEAHAQGRDLDELWRGLRKLYPVGITFAELVDSGGDLAYDGMVAALIADAERAYAAREAEIATTAGPGAMRQVERAALLSIIDGHWREYLRQLGDLRRTVAWRPYANAHGVETKSVDFYGQDAHAMFSAMSAALDRESIRCLFNVEVVPVGPQSMTECTASQAREVNPP
ncbi:preprotein translocase subunit SecA [[Mycobacterium] vasticus]|uniref:Protein translocase subunit SecA n=1 Tax=[Mycobacterium] vasticus TaxID=2875777 RepID=A0ABU5Z7X3_9MYCO|nr:DEAD/DEAH box helicase [Mycolicibacter sp. MYC017]MEB3072028.1 DEAD/DEAH box helicase [Mycolicibacter sp. MYC017]